MRKWDTGVDLRMPIEVLAQFKNGHLRIMIAVIAIGTGINQCLQCFLCIVPIVPKLCLLPQLACAKTLCQYPTPYRGRGNGIGTEGGLAQSRQRWFVLREGEHESFSHLLMSVLVCAMERGNIGYGAYRYGSFRGGFGNR